MNLSDEDKQLVIECLNMRIDYIRRDGTFAEYKKVGVLAGDPRNFRIYPQLSDEQIAFLAKLIELRDRLRGVSMLPGPPYG